MLTGGDLPGELGTLTSSGRPHQGAYAGPAQASATCRIIGRPASAVAERLTQPIGVSGLSAFPVPEADRRPCPVISPAHRAADSAGKCAPSTDEYPGAEPAGSGPGLPRKINKPPLSAQRLPAAGSANRSRSAAIASLSRLDDADHRVPARRTCSMPRTAHHHQQLRMPRPARPQPGGDASPGHSRAGEPQHPQNQPKEEN